VFKYGGTKQTWVLETAGFWYRDRVNARHTSMFVIILANAPELRGTEYDNDGMSVGNEDIVDDDDDEEKNIDCELNKRYFHCTSPIFQQTST
jgi:hypothetical protein